MDTVELKQTEGSPTTNTSRKHKNNKRLEKKQLLRVFLSEFFVCFRLVFLVFSLSLVWAGLGRFGTATMKPFWSHSYGCDLPALDFIACRYH